MTDHRTRCSDSIVLRCAMPKLCFDSKLVDGLHQHAEVVTENLAQDFVNLGNVRFGTDAATKLCLDHMEGGFDIAAAVVVPKKVVLAVEIVMQHLVPRSGFLAARIIGAIEGGVGLGCDKRLGSAIYDGLDVGFRKISLIGGNALHLEPFGRLFEKFNTLFKNAFPKPGEQLSLGLVPENDD